MTTSNIEMIWAVRYRDGAFISQFDGDRERSFKEVDLTRVCNAGWIPVPKEWKVPGFGHNPRLRELWIDAGADLYMRRRMELRYMRLNKPTVQCYIIGVRGRANKIYPNGRVICQTS